jgi:alpha-glucosidase
MNPEAEWWRTAVVYQIYPRSFADSDGDGLGDLDGVAQKADYLAGLGVDAVWLSPFYPSALADGGYDVDDYRDVDARLGGLAAFDRMVAALHAKDIRVVIDIVPNHSGSGHVWFQQALAAKPGSPERDRYYFRDGIGPDKSQPPTDWTASFGGSAWEPVGDGQFYLHSFAPEQPDWNWSNPEVRQEFLKTLAFWADRGTDGFRIDVGLLLSKDLSEPLPSSAELWAIPPGPQHRTVDRDELDVYYAEWRELFNRYDPPRFAVGEMWLENKDRLARFARPDSLGQVFDFELLMADFDAAQWRTDITNALAVADKHDSTLTWVLSNHDKVRHATRYGLPNTGGGEQRNNAAMDAWLKTGGTDPVENRTLGLARAKAAIMTLLALPGSVYLFQGEELGLPEVADIPDAARQDPIFFHSDAVGRDGVRVPIPWNTDSPAFGFSATAPHLPQPAWFADFAVSNEDQDPDSTLNFYREALHLRSTYLDDLENPDAPASLTWLDYADPVLGFTRPNGWTCITNFGDTAVDLPAGEVLLKSAPLLQGKLPENASVWMTLKS